MKRPIVHLSRRQVLRGAGGIAIGLPFLPSLIRGAHAADPIYVPNRRFVALTTDHGGVWGSNMYPADALLTNRRTLYPGHDIRSGNLVASRSGDNTVLSAVLTARSSRFTDALIAKMNVVRGLDIAFNIAHHTGGHLGNFARNDGNGTEGQQAQLSPMPTIDQVMAWSPSFYPDLSQIRERAMVTGDRNWVSYDYSSPSTRSGEIQEIQPMFSSLDLFNRIFVPQNDTEPKRAPVVDRILENYKSLRNGNRRLSAADRQRLDDHVERLAELQRRLSVRVSCGDVTIPTKSSTDIQDRDRDPSKNAEFQQLINDVIVTAFSCGTSRIAVRGVGNHFTDFAGDWHNAVAHRDRETEPQGYLVRGLQRTFEEAFLDLAAKLDAIEEAPGVTLLDGSLLAWSQECGAETHESNSIPLVTFGSAGGYLNTGLYCDYRNRASDQFLLNGGGNDEQKAMGFYDYTGLLWNQWLATALQAMGVPPSEYDTSGNVGYGYSQIGGSWKGRQVSGVVENAGTPLPVIVRG